MRKQLAAYGTAQRQLDTCRQSACTLLAESIRLHQSILACAVRKPTNIIFKRQERGLRGHYSGSSCRYIATFLQCLCTYIRSQLVSLLLHTVCNWLACIAMPCLDTDTSRRIVFLKSAGYLVSQIKKRHRQTVLIEYFLIFQPSDWPNTKRLMEIQSPRKDPFSGPIPFSTPNNSTTKNKWHEVLHATASEQLFSRIIDSRINWNIQRQHL